MTSDDVINAIATHGPMTCPQIAAHLGEPLMRVNSRAKVLRESGRLVVVDMQPRAGGPDVRVYGIGKPPPPRPIVVAPTAYPTWMAPPAPAAPPPAPAVARRATWMPTS